MSKMFYSCEKLSFIDISSFKANSTNTTLFDENLPDNGKIVIDKIFEPIIKNQLPINWEIKIKE